MATKQSANEVPPCETQRSAEPGEACQDVLETDGGVLCARHSGGNWWVGKLGHSYSFINSERSQDSREEKSEEAVSLSSYSAQSGNRTMTVLEGTAAPGKGNLNNSDAEGPGRQKTLRRAARGKARVIKRKTLIDRSIREGACEQIPTRTTWYPKFSLQVHGCWFTVKFFSNASQPHPLHRVRMSSALQILRASGTRNAEKSQGPVLQELSESLWKKNLRTVWLIIATPVSTVATAGAPPKAPPASSSIVPDP
ncbi:hypothetical protein MJT46_001724 [Ovis ammon polii x Ovis aries]|nr:hypothetical protein MJT46_001724 [Ovis ammon polii x Ovis aries]